MTPEQKQQQLEKILARHCPTNKRECPTPKWQMREDINFLLSLVKSQEVREGVPCACHTFDLDPVIRAYLSDKFIHTTIGCPALPLGDDQNCLICHHDRKSYNAEADACEHTTGLTKIDIFCGCACRFPIPDAATSMRSACVEKVRPILRDYELEFRRKTNSQTNIVDYVVMALESVSIQEQEK